MLRQIRAAGIESHTRTRLGGCGEAVASSEELGPRAWQGLVLGSLDNGSIPEAQIELMASSGPPGRSK